MFSGSEISAGDTTYLFLVSLGLYLQLRVRVRTGLTLSYFVRRDETPVPFHSIPVVSYKLAQLIQRVFPFAISSCCYTGIVSSFRSLRKKKERKEMSVWEEIDHEASGERVVL